LLRLLQLLLLLSGSEERGLRCRGGLCEGRAKQRWLRLVLLRVAEQASRGAGLGILRWLAKEPRARSCALLLLLCVRLAKQTAAGGGSRLLLILLLLWLTEQTTRSRGFACAKASSKQTSSSSCTRLLLLILRRLPK
jgi:hypothetical protein